MNERRSEMNKKTILVTGASSGIGKATALKLLAEGHHVVAGARRVDAMTDIREAGGTAVHLDVTDDASRRAFVETAHGKLGRIDVLVNNAGYGHFGSMEETSLDAGRAMYEVNLVGMVAMTQLVVPAMRKQHAGAIVNMSSIGGKMTTPFCGWYQSTKYAVECVSNALRMELHQWGIDVIIIEPGLIETGFFSIAKPALLAISGSGPYAASAKKMAETMDETYAEASPPSVIAETIARALDQRRPKTRYVAGKQGWSTLLAAKLLGDRGFDKMVMGMTMATEDGEQ
jgi:short-subunit dehydrogenase